MIHNVNTHTHMHMHTHTTQANADDLATKYAMAPSVANCKRYTRLKRPPTGFAIDHYAGSGACVHMVLVCVCVVSLCVDAFVRCLLFSPSTWLAS